MEPSPHECIERVWARVKPNSPIYDLFLKNVEIVSAEKGSFTARFTLEPIHVNSSGSLHGAVSAAIVDWAGGMAIASHGLEKTGVSTDIHVTYLSTARIGDRMEIQGQVNKLGRTLAFTTVTILRLGHTDGVKTIVSTGTHTKYIKQS